MTSPSVAQSCPCCKTRDREPWDDLCAVCRAVNPLDAPNSPYQCACGRWLTAGRYGEYPRP